MIDLLLKNGLVYCDGEFKKLQIGIKNEKIVLLSGEDIEIESRETIDLEGDYAIPGTIDTHMHVRDPGHTERGNFYTETLAAAAGGVTTIMEHPISVPPQYNVEILDKRIERASQQCVVDFCFYGAAGAEYSEEITKLADDGRIVAFKSFLHAAPEGREQEFQGLTMANDSELYIGMKELAKTGLIAAFHAENNDIIQANIAQFIKEKKTSAIYHALSRPVISEVTSVERVIAFARETGAKVEIAHVSTDSALEIIKKAKQEGIKIFAETCPHYLFLTEDDLIKKGAYAKCNPPLRSKEIVEGLWKYVNDGTIDYIGSDHSPFLVEEKESGKDNIFKAAAGFPGVDLRLPLMLNAVAEGKICLKKVVDLLSVNPAKCFGIYPQKGYIGVGADADITTFSFKKHMKVDKNKNYSHAREIALAYDGMELKASVTRTILRGRRIMENSVVDQSAKGYGKLVMQDKSKGDKNEL